jgi:hypothetical protein
MRLLKTKTFELVQANEIPDLLTDGYPVFSHTWREDEYTYQDIINGTGTDKKGYQKVKKICEIACNLYGWDYIWIDNCCINQASSQELGEAINSMFNFYKESAVCFVYLDDVKVELLPCPSYYIQDWDAIPSGKMVHQRLDAPGTDCPFFSHILRSRLEVLWLQNR